MTWTGRPFPLVIAAPSGAGKTTLSRALVERTRDLVFSLSATTRPRRESERPGRDYHFVDPAEFARLEATGELLESAWVHGHRYGVLREDVDRALAGGKSVVLDIDVQGARSVRSLYAGAVLVFVLPPSAAELERRLASRGSEDESQRRARLHTALEELQAVQEFDYVVVNDDFETALAALQSIVAAERQRRTRFVALESRVEQLERVLKTMLDGRSNESLHSG
jgi:guanylate kinase